MTELRKVMLVEDDPDIAVIAEIALKEIGGLEFVHFASGRDALAGARGAGPDLIILDYRMPDMNGIEVLKALRGDPLFRSVPILFMTASLMPKHVGSLIELGALAVLAKPFDPMTLADQVRDIWRSRPQP